MNFAIYGKMSYSNHTPYMYELLFKLQKLNAQIFIFESLYAFLKQSSPSGLSLPVDIKTFNKHEDIKEKVDYLISIGGDGTFLETISFVRDSGIPILGINTGRLGFLSSVSKEEIDSSLDALVQNKFSLDKRVLLQLETPNKLFGDVNFALNEITVQKKDSSSMIIIHTYLNGAFLNSYWADGLIIATPTGSTAYSLSCGGPIVIPNSENFIITPISPHNLNVRPLVISDKDVITLRVEGRSKQYLVSLDSHSEVSDSSIELTIKKEIFKISIVKFEGQNFSASIRNKLLWGIDKRN